MPTAGSRLLEFAQESGQYQNANGPMRELWIDSDLQSVERFCWLRICEEMS